MKSMKPLLLVPVVLLLAGVGWLLLTNLEEPLTHEQAMERWPELVQNGFKGEPKKIARIFKECFREGDSAWDYERLLATATERYEYRNSNHISYSWTWDLGHGGNEGDASFVVVTTQDYPPVIEHVYISAILH
jgi:hypothetical protein